MIDYWPNGQKEKEGSFKDGIKDGKWTYLHSNGRKEKEGTFLDGKEDGIWTYWFNNGQKMKVYWSEYILLVLRGMY